MLNDDCSVFGVAVGSVVGLAVDVGAGLGDAVAIGLWVAVGAGVCVGVAVGAGVGVGVAMGESSFKVKVAVIVLFPSMVSVVLVAPVTSPLQPLKVQFSSFMASRLPDAPEGIVWFPGDTVPLPTVMMVRVYVSCVKMAFMVMLDVIVMLAGVSEPVRSPLQWLKYQSGAATGVSWTLSL